MHAYKHTDTHTEAGVAEAVTSRKVMKQLSQKLVELTIPMSMMLKANSLQAKIPKAHCEITAPLSQNFGAVPDKPWSFF